MRIIRTSLGSAHDSIFWLFAEDPLDDGWTGKCVEYTQIWSLEECFIVLLKQVDVTFI